MSHSEADIVTTEAPSQQIVIALPANDVLMKTPTRMSADLEIFGDIDSQDLYAVAADDLRAAKARRKELEELRTHTKAPMLEGGRRIDALFKRPMEMLDSVITGYNTKMVAWNDRCERIRREEQARADAVAKAERERLQREADEARLLAEKEAAAIEKKAEKAAAKGDENAAADLKARADEARMQGEYQATARREQAAMVSSEIAPAAAKTAGTHVAGRWKAEVVDLMQVVKHVAEHPEHLGVLQINQTALTALARAMGTGFNRPGAKAYRDKSIVTK